MSSEGVPSHSEGGDGSAAHYSLRSRFAGVPYGVLIDLYP